MGFDDRFLHRTRRRHRMATKIKNWSVHWDEARDLEALVVAGRLDGLSASSIRQRYPQFEAFAYKPFYSGLSNIRRKHNKEVQARIEP